MRDADPNHPHLNLVCNGVMFNHKFTMLPVVFLFGSEVVFSPFSSLTEGVFRVAIHQLGCRGL